ncbi:olfactory receptor 5G3-like, partial [Pelobates cultripes]
FNYVVPPKEEYLGLQKLISMLYTIAAPLLNPIIYSLRNEQFKEEANVGTDRKKFVTQSLPSA